MSQQPPAREPWQMTKEEYCAQDTGELAVRVGGSNRLLARQSRAFREAGIPLIDRGHVLLGHHSNRHAVMPDTPEARALLKKVGGRIAREQPEYYARGYDHEGIVKKALREGKPVPKEVLFSYPDLSSMVPKEE